MKRVVDALMCAHDLAKMRNRTFNHARDEKILIRVAVERSYLRIIFRSRLGILSVRWIIVVHGVITELPDCNIRQETEALILQRLEYVIRRLKL